MLFGVGASLARLISSAEMNVLPALSSYSLAAARLGWALHEVELLSIVARPIAALNARIFANARLLILSNDGTSPHAIANLLRARGFGASRITVLEHLGGTCEQRIDASAQLWSLDKVAALNLVAVECIADHNAQHLALTIGLPDSAYRHDGQLTKRDVRAITLARLAPQPGELLWDVGAGCGSICIEWMRAHPRCRAIAIEADTERQQLIEHNRDALGVPALQLIRGEAPHALQGLEAPDAIFIGGGVTVPGVLETCWQQLRSGGRLIANAVTLQSEMVLQNWRAQHGGELTRINVAQAQPLGEFDTWRAAPPITLCWKYINRNVRSINPPHSFARRHPRSTDSRPRSRPGTYLQLSGARQGTDRFNLRACASAALAAPQGWRSLFRSEHIDLVLDVTHPYAAQISTNAASAAQQSQIPYWALHRPGWQPQASDSWRPVENWPAVIAALANFQRPFFTLGREPLAHLDEIPASQFWTIRCLDAEHGNAHAQHHRRAWTVSSSKAERQLFASHHFETF